MTGIANKIMRRVRAKGRGKWVCTAKDFLDLGSRAAVGQALSRLAKNGDLRRAGRGLYYLPQWSNFLKRHVPADLDLMVDALVRRDNIRIIRSGGFYANGLGLTNAVAARIIYDTDGPTRTVKVGGFSVHFRHAGPKIMAWAGRDSAHVVQALRWLGPLASQDRRVVASLASLKRVMPDRIKRDLARNIADCPDWTRPIVRNLIEKEKQA